MVPEASVPSHQFRIRLVEELGCWQYLLSALADEANHGELPMGRGQWVAQAYQIEQAGLSHSERCDGPQMPATMDHLLHIPQWVPLSVAEPVQALALLGEYGYLIVHGSVLGVRALLCLASSYELIGPMVHHVD